MAISSETQVGVTKDPYRSFLDDESAKETVWRHGEPPVYDTVNKLFEEGRTQVWPKGSLEETVENLVKTWEMELSHKVRLQDFKTIDHQDFSFIINGRPGMSAEETLKVGSYNALLQTSVEELKKCYDHSKETFESSHDIFKTAFPRGFAWEVLEVFSGPPKVTFKFRHWAYMDGPYKSHPPSNQIIQFIGMANAQLNESGKITNLEVYYDPSELLGGLCHESSSSSGCPFKTTQSAQTSSPDSLIW